MQIRVSQLSIKFQAKYVKPKIKPAIQVIVVSTKVENDKPVANSENYLNNKNNFAKLTLYLGKFSDNLHPLLNKNETYKLSRNAI